jgi:hypothetical protein
LAPYARIEHVLGTGRGEALAHAEVLVVPDAKPLSPAADVDASSPGDIGPSSQLEGNDGGTPVAQKKRLETSKEKQKRLS